MHSQKCIVKDSQKSFQDLKRNFFNNHVFILKFQASLLFVSNIALFWDLFKKGVKINIFFEKDTDLIDV